MKVRNPVTLRLPEKSGNQGRIWARKKNKGVLWWDLHWPPKAHVLKALSPALGISRRWWNL